MRCTRTTLAPSKSVGVEPKHLSNIFQKPGVSSRGELADVIREKGLLEK